MIDMTNPDIVTVGFSIKPEDRLRIHRDDVTKTFQFMMRVFEEGQKKGHEEAVKKGLVL